MKRIATIAAALATMLQGQTQEPSQSISHFGIDLYHKTATAKSSNMVMSPFSISPTMAMVALGAKGETKQQMTQTMHYSSSTKFYKQMGNLLRDLAQHQQVEICITNRVWMEQSYKTRWRYRRNLTRCFDAQAHQLNFKQQPEDARISINNTIADDTKKHITNLLPLGSITPSTRLVLTNAIYFKGKWATTIDPNNTKKRNFTLSDGSTIECPTMYTHSEYPLYQGSNYRALQIDYQGNALSLLILLPDEGTTLQQLEQHLSPELYQSTLDGLRSDGKVKVYLPKFKINTNITLKPMLCEMGMPIAFSGGADFSGMSGAKDLCIGNVYHKAFIEVSEEGTTAAAATAATMIRKSALERDKIFRADRPFLFVLKDNASGTILFMGKVERPS